LRAASNANIFAQETKDIFGVDIVIMNQTDEARYLYKGLAPLVDGLSF
jgi:exopolyphosphatase/pppGpp-phosphohydrolase